MKLMKLTKVTNPNWYDDLDQTAIIETANISMNKKIIGFRVVGGYGTSEVGEISVTASREQLDYNEHTIKVLKKKMEEVKEEIKELLVKQYENIVTLKDYFVFKNEFGKLNFPNSMVLTTTNLIKQSDINLSNFKYSFMKMPNDRQLFHFFFESKRYGKKTHSRYSDKSFEGGYEALKRNSNLLYVEGEFIRKVSKQSYLKNMYSTYFIISKRNLCESYMRSEISELFNVHLHKLVDDNGKPVEKRGRKAKGPKA